MKRLSLIVALLLMIAMPMMAERVTPETAQKVAKTFLNNNGAKSAQLTDLSRTAGFSNLYIFNGEEGFVVMAADDCVQPILGYSLTGKFVIENMPENIKGWLEGYNDEIKYAIDSKMKAINEITKMWKDLVEGDAKLAKATIVVDALVQTQWDQDPLYNNLCPYSNYYNELTVTGCVATAMAQIMKYWDYPSHGVGSHTYNHTSYTDSYGYHDAMGQLTANFGNTYYDWSNMPIALTGSSTDNQINAVATLMYHCGVAVDMDYGVSSIGGSGAYNSAIPSALTNYFNYKSTASLKNKSSYSTTNWNNLLKTELNAGRPIQYNGSGSGGGHSFVCDGYDNSNYFHFNWGWSGANDGFYSLTNLNPGSGGSGGGSYSFSQNQSAVIGIQPKDCLTTTPTNFSVTKEERNAILSWTSANNAVYYYIYRNNLLIANTANTTFIDESLSYGIYTYYIKSVDSNGSTSSPTQILPIAIEPVPSQLIVTKQNNNAILSWIEPEWCSPSSDDEVLTYSYGSTIYSFGGGGTTKYYFGHKYPAAMISTNKVLYKVSFYPCMTGAFRLYVYTANAGNNRPQNQVYSQDITVSSIGWNDIVLSTPLQLNASKDLWVFIYDPIGRNYPMGAGAYEGTDNNGNYITTNPLSGVTAQNVVMLINTYITDGAFTYDLFDGTTTIASNISSTTYTINNIANNTVHRYTLKTNYNGGLTEASNMVGLTLGNASLTSLNMTTNDKMTITAGSKLTVTGTLSNSVASNLVIENGAQLVNNSNGVKATVIQNISAYTRDQSKGWHLIASPITESITQSSGNGLFSNTYDLYSYNQSEELQWRNIKAQSFALNNKGGYLYANSGNPSISFSGTLVGSTSSTPLSYNANVTGKGFNLIGNPYPCNANVNRSFYVLNADGSDFILGSNPVPPCAAIMVQAQGANQNVTFSKASSKSSPSITLSVMQGDTEGSTILDRVRINLDSDESLEKYSMREDNAKLFITQNGQDLAVASANGTNKMPISFKAAQDGTYVLSLEIENAEIGYLHLIDDLTGKDIDLLTIPNYTFEAQKDGMTSRFRLVFNAE